jgi:hypothetical protein
MSETNYMFLILSVKFNTPKRNDYNRYTEGRQGIQKQYSRGPGFKSEPKYQLF